MMARKYQNGQVEKASGFTIADLLDSVRQGNFDRTQVIDTVECMNKILATLESQVLRKKSEDCENKLEDYLERLLENATSKVISTASTKTSSGGGQGTP